MLNLTTIVTEFEANKVWLETASGLGKDALHVYAGMVVFLTVKLIWRRRGGWALAWLAALIVACSGEWLDMVAEGQKGVIQPDAAHWHDVWNTMFWPTVLLVVGRWLATRAGSSPNAEEPLVSGEDAESSLEQA